MCYLSTVALPRNGTENWWNRKRRSDTHRGRTYSKTKDYSCLGYKSLTSFHSLISFTKKVYLKILWKVFREWKVMLLWHLSKNFPWYIDLRFIMAWLPRRLSVWAPEWRSPLSNQEMVNLSPRKDTAINRQGSESLTLSLCGFKAPGSRMPLPQILLQVC